MRTKLLVTAIIVAVFAASLLGKWLLGRQHGDNLPENGKCERIVSMSPSITETLFTLDVGDRVVGVTRYCRYPPEVEEIATVGGLFDPNFETLLALKPDLVVALVEHEKTAGFKKLNLNTLIVSHKSVAGILDSFTAIGEAVGAEATAEKLVAKIKTRIQRVQQKTAGRDRPRVVVCIYRAGGSGKLQRVTVAAAGGYFDKIITMAGGRNACQDTAAPFPVVSAERILWMNPEVIVEVVRPMSQTGLDRETILADWQQVAEVEAVRRGRVYVLDDDFASVPGPRFVLLVEKLARLIHPQLDWD